jgi:hypothetical protein
MAIVSYNAKHLQHAFMPCAQTPPSPVSSVVRAVVVNAVVKSVVVNSAVV